MAKNKGQNITPTRPEPNAPLITEQTQQSPMHEANRPGNKKGPGPQNRGGANAR